MSVYHTFFSFSEFHSVEKNILSLRGSFRSGSAAKLDERCGVSDRKFK